MKPSSSAGAVVNLRVCSESSSKRQKRVTRTEQRSAKRMVPDGAVELVQATESSPNLERIAAAEGAAAVAEVERLARMEELDDVIAV